MNHLVIYSHPNPASFSAALKEQISSTLQKLGHNVTIRDLYALNYNPVLGQGDFASFARYELPDDTREEQFHVATAEVLHFIYPLWWTGLPTMLKGYVERTFTPGFAYKWGNDGKIKLLEGKSAMLWTPHGNTQEEYSANGMYKAMESTIHTGIFDYVGMEVRHHRYFPNIRATDQAQRKQWLGEVEESLQADFEKSNG